MFGSSSGIGFFSCPSCSSLTSENRRDLYLLLRVLHIILIILSAEFCGVLEYVWLDGMPEHNCCLMGKLPRFQYSLWVMGGLVPFAASFLAEPMAQSSHPPLVAKTWAKIYSGTKNASGSWWPNYELSFELNMWHRITIICNCQYRKNGANKRKGDSAIM